MSKSYRGGIPFARKYAPPEKAESYIQERIFLSLKNGADCALEEGDTVKKYGMILGKTDSSPAVFAGVGGKVEHIYRIGSRVDITLLTDPDAEVEVPFDAPEKSIADLTDIELSSLLLERGILPLKKGKRDPRALTVDCSSSPYNDSRLYVCRAFPEEVLLGAKIIMKLIGARSCNLAIPRSDLDAAQNIYDHIPKKSDMFKIVLVKDKLPATIPNLTVSALYNVEVSAVKDIIDAGYPVVSPLYCLSCYRALVDGIPFCESYLTVAELGAELDVFRVPFGTSLKSVANPSEGERVIRAENLYGAEITGEVMTERTEAIAIIPNETAKAKASKECIGCFRCIDACPSRISPIDIFSSVKDEKNTPSLVAYAASCFECRACSYVCPSELPLAETIRKFRHDSGLISLDIEGEDPDFYDDIQEKEAEHE
ncbi:MAG: 4Fe-4S dicluster domain-containing protein [Ruminococcaceae bacterium]|nr:4Fe-4S dicluster domain-containing protein [Oscillospiraceae bacterium]